ncbi:MAG: hypothetical protein K0R24_179 [Gammaproteobacteria bacterium]|nr:hypothetical protein [Gammaproteobacteria bacterium]
MDHKKSKQNNKSIENLNDFAEMQITILAAFRTFYSLRWEDLHGLSVEQAKLRVKKAVMESVKNGCRTCRIITGRGNHVNARGERGTIFNACESWLESDELKPFIENYEKRVGHYVVKMKRMSNFAPVENFNHQNIKNFYKNNLSNLQLLANQGEARSQFLVGCAYALGIELSCDYKKAFNVLLKAANQEHGPAQEFIGMFYYVGEGVRQDDKKAMEWLEKAVNNGRGTAAYTLSSAYFYGFGCGINTKLSAAWAARGAVLGDLFSMRRVGNLYLHGYPEESVPKDIKKAIRWYTQAAKNGDAYSQYQLGCFYKNGEGVPLNLEEGFKWYLLSAKTGDTDGMIGVAACYLEGSGCERNMQAAKEWLEKADELGHPDAKLMLSAYYISMGDISKALELRQISADSGSVQAQVKIFTDPLTDRDLREKVLFQLLEQPVSEITQHSPLFIQFLVSQCLLMKMAATESKSQTKKNNRRGLLLLEDLAKKGHSEALLLMGAHFCQNNFDKAMEYWEKGATLSDMDCLFLAGLLYKDAGKGKQYVDRAVQAKHPAALLHEALIPFKSGFSEDDETFQSTLSQLIVSIKEGIKADKSNYLNISWGVDLVPARALLAIITLLLRQPYRLKLDNEIVQASLALLRQAANENNRDVQYYLGIYLITVGCPLEYREEFTNWMEDLTRVDPSVREQPWFALYIMFSKHYKTPFAEGLDWLKKSEEAGNLISKEIIKTVLQNPFYTVEQISSIPGVGLIGINDLDFRKIEIYPLVKKKMMDYQTYLLNCWLEGSKEENSRLNSQELTGSRVDEDKDKSKMQSEPSEALVEASITMALAESFSQLFKMSSTHLTTGSSPAASSSQTEHISSINLQSVIKGQSFG